MNRVAVITDIHANLSALEATLAEVDRLDVDARSLSRSFFFEFPTRGHWVLPVSGCARRLELAFLDTPARRPDTSCLRRTRMRWALHQSS